MASRIKLIVISLVTILVLVGGGVLYFTLETTTINNRDQIHQKQTGTRNSEFQLQRQVVSFPGGETHPFQIPESFEISIAETGFGMPRFMTKSSDGRIFVADMNSWVDDQSGTVWVLDQFSDKQAQFGSVNTYLSDLRNPHDVTFYQDQSGTDWIYVSETHRLVRYRYKPELNQPGDSEVVARFPDYGNSYEEGGWHLTRTVVFNNDTLYVSVGSSCNVCEEKPDEIRAEIIRMNPDGSNRSVYAEGLRNAVGLEWVPSSQLPDRNRDQLYAVEMGVDHLGDSYPDDPLYEISQETHYGWPYCYEIDGEVYPDDYRDWKRKSIQCDNVPQSLTGFDPHSAPMGITFFGNDAPPLLKGNFLVALKGSANISLAEGYNLTRVTLEGDQAPFMTGFLQDGKRFARPVGIQVWDSNSFFVTDDYGGRLFYVSRNN
ncbi:MAG: sorbosone dehydrogenase family protein [bacterium]